MRKKLLFVIPSLTAGGAERSLINLLAILDFKRYEVDLFMFNHEGLFMELIPEDVHVLPLPENYSHFVMPIRNSVSKFLLDKNAMLAFNRIMFSYKNRASNNVSIGEQKSWKYMASSIRKMDKKYDVAIAFLEKTSIYFCTEKVEASKKIGWVHNDYDKLGMDPDFDLDYFQKLDHIVTVSEECGHILKRRFPNQNNKVEVIHNIVSPKVIKQLSEKGSHDVFGRKEKETVILSIGRLNTQKGFELAIEACGIMKDWGISFQWNIIGEGEERQNLLELIDAAGLQQHVKLLGLKSNPYPYIKQADIYAQTSRFEGKAIAIDEAKILNKPILITNFSTARDQLEDGIEGLIVDMNAEAVAHGIAKLIQNQSISKQMSEHLSQLQLGTEEEINKLYSLLG